MGWRQHTYTEGDVGSILFRSEGTPTTFRSGAEGHAYGEHVAATRSRMRDHAMDVGQLTTAFLPMREQQIRAATFVLNHHVSQGALARLDASGAAGLRVINEAPMPEIPVRCADAIKNWTELAGAACMIIDSTKTGAGIHIQTFYPIRYFNSADEYGRRPLYRHSCPTWWQG